MTGRPIVWFDQADKVKHVRFAPAINRATFLEKLRRWLRL
jgi:hypothetical protein